jgi:hypothetical protein
MPSRSATAGPLRPRRMADAAGTAPDERADFLEIERRWLSLARTYESSEG